MKTLMAPQCTVRTTSCEGHRSDGYAAAPPWMKRFRPIESREWRLQTCIAGSCRCSGHDRLVWTAVEPKRPRSAAMLGPLVAIQQPGVRRRADPTLSAGLRRHGKHCLVRTIEKAGSGLPAPTGAPAGLGVVGALRSPQRETPQGAPPCPAYPPPSTWFWRPPRPAPTARSCPSPTGSGFGDGPVSLCSRE